MASYFFYPCFFFCFVLLPYSFFYPLFFPFFWSYYVFSSHLEPFHFSLSLFSFLTFHSFYPLSFCLFYYSVSSYLFYSFFFPDLPFFLPTFLLPFLLFRFFLPFLLFFLFSLSAALAFLTSALIQPPSLLAPSTRLGSSCAALLTLPAPPKFPSQAEHSSTFPVNVSKAVPCSPARSPLMAEESTSLPETQPISL